MSLKPYVNDREFWDEFLKETSKRIESARRGLEQTNEPEDMYRYQGEIKALRKLQQLREQLNAKQHG